MHIRDGIDIWFSSADWFVFRERKTASAYSLPAVEAALCSGDGELP